MGVRHVLERASRLPHDIMIQYAGVGGSIFYGVSYWLLIRYTGQPSTALFLILVALGFCIGVATYSASCYLKEQFLKRHKLTEGLVARSIGFGRALFVGLSPVILLVALLHMSLGFYLLGMALVVQKAAEIYLTARESHISWRDNILATLFHTAIINLFFVVVVALIR